jgi:hypothetical protein
MNLIQQPVLMASSTNDSSVGVGVLLVMFAMIVAAVALRSLSKWALRQRMSVGLRQSRSYRLSDAAAPCDGCPAD